MKSSGGTPLDEFDDPSPFLRPRGGSIWVPYDGQGTPPTLPVPDNADRESVFVFDDRRQSVFAATDAQDPPRSTAIFVPKDELPACPIVAIEDKQAKRKSQQPSYPCDAIAAILARKDL